MSPKKIIRPVRTIEEIREQVNIFNQDLSRGVSRNSWGSIFRSSKLWIYDPLTKSFAMNSFAGFYKMNLNSYWDRREVGLSSARSAITRTIAQSTLTNNVDYRKDPLLLRRFKKWANNRFGGIMVFGSTTDFNKFEFLELPPKDISFAVSVPEKNVGELEGGKVLKVRYTKERNRSLRNKAVSYWQHQHGELRCHICNFSFTDQYGSLGMGFIEVHHKNLVPSAKAKVQLKDLVPVCANCHRMLHRNNGLLEIKDVIAACRKKF